MQQAHFQENKENLSFCIDWFWEKHNAKKILFEKIILEKDEACLSYQSHSIGPADLVSESLSAEAVSL